MPTTSKLPPGPRALPWLGSLIELTRDPLGFYYRLATKYGDIAYAKVVNTELYFISDSALIEELLNGQHKACIKDSLTRELKPLVGEGLLTSEGEPWRRQRKLASQPFSPKRIDRYGDAMVAHAERLCERFVDGERREFHEDASALALQIASSTLFGANTERESARVSELLAQILAYFEERMTTWMRALPPRFPTRKLRAFDKAKRELDEIVRGIIESTRRGDPEADHLLNRLLHARDEQGQPLDEQLLLDEAVTILLAGHETTALSLMYAVYLLSKHPAVLARVQAELDQVLAGRAPRTQDLDALPYLDAVIREALRLYPPAYAFGREVISPFELAGYSIPVGAQVVISTYGLHRLPKYFPEPERFLPERWLPGGSANKLPRYAYLPFGGGPRVCIGMHFAQLELALVLATMLQRVELHVQPGFDPTLRAVVTMRSHEGLPVRVRRRPSLAERAPSLPAPPAVSEALLAAAREAGCPHAATRRA